MARRIKVKEGKYGLDWETKPSYDDIVETFGKILAAAEDADYQGDSLYLIDQWDDEAAMHRYGILTFGWGSCSGCDALEGANSQSDIDALQDDLERGIKWFDDIDDAEEYLAEGGLKDSYLNSRLVLEFGGKVAEVRG